MIPPSRSVSEASLQGSLVSLFGGFLFVAASLITADAAAAAVPSGPTSFVQSAPVVPSVTPALSDMPTYVAPRGPAQDINPRMTWGRQPGRAAAPFLIDPMLDLQASAVATARALDSIIFNFDGQGFTGVNPPDPVGDIGPSHYVQMVNGSGGAVVTVYDKTTGALLSGPTQLDSLAVPGSNCDAGSGDPVVIYDEAADRWVLTEFASPSDVCIYISQTPNPAGAYYAYDFTTPNFPDYFKIAVWTDAYYGTSNESSPAVYAFDRAQMLAGGAATYQRFTAPLLSGFGFQTLTPADIDGTAPPAGSPGIFMRHVDTEAHSIPGYPTQDILEIWAFQVDWVTPANSTFTKLPDILVSEFDSDLCGLISFQCFPQPGTSVILDPLREMIMHRLAYRNFGDHETLVGNFVTDVDGTDHGGIRWFELYKSGASGWSLLQEGTYAPDANNRWIGAIAMDRSGNMAIGYNITSSSVYPGIRYTGRLAGDPRGSLPQGEYILVNGTASNSSYRYGDYSAMSVDPSDGCTFWFTGEWNGASTWSTRIGAFKFDDCGFIPVEKHFASMDVPKSIPDCLVEPCTQPPADSVLDIPAGFCTSVMDLNLSLQITHSYVGDLIVTLTHTDTGTSAVVLDRPGAISFPPYGCNGDNIDATLDDEAATYADDQCNAIPPAISGGQRPNNLLSVFDGENPSGTWTLTASDNAIGDAGSLDAWGLIIKCATVDLVRVVGGGTSYYPTIQLAYNGAAAGNTIQAQAFGFAENLVFDRNISVILKGGFNTTFTANTGMTNNTGSLTISAGTVTAENITIL